MTHSAGNIRRIEHKLVQQCRHNRPLQPINFKVMKPSRFVTMRKNVVEFLNKSSIISHQYTSTFVINAQQTFFCKQSIELVILIKLILRRSWFEMFD